MADAPAELSQPVGDDDGGAPTDVEVSQLLRASRGLVRIAARSIAPVEDAVTLPQYRLLLRLRSRARSGVHLAEDLGVHPSTVVRMVDRLESKGLLRRRRDDQDRRVALLELTAEGKELIDGVTDRRRSELAQALSALTPAQRAGLVHHLGLLATDEDADLDAWSL